MEEREQGTVRWYRVDKGFGYIMREDDSDVYVPQSSIRVVPAILVEGQIVEFSVKESIKGPTAFDVILLPSHNTN